MIESSAEKLMIVDDIIVEENDLVIIHSAEKYTTKRKDTN